MKFIITILCFLGYSYSNAQWNWVSSGGSLYLKNGNDSAVITGFSQYTTAYWGQVFGNITNQADLQTALNAKQASIATGTTLQYFRGDFSLAVFPTTTAAFTNSANKNFVTDAQATVIGNTSGTNSGDNAVNSLYSGLVSNANHTGDATGSTALTLATVNANVGSFGSATQTGTFTVNAKGLITAASAVTITPAVGSITGFGTGVSSALAINTGSAGAFVIFNGALGTPSSGVATNLTGTASNLTAGNVTTNANLTGDVTSVGNATTIGATKVTNAMLAGSIAASKLVGTDIATTGKITSYNGVTTASNGLASIVATIDATAQAANIATATLYAVPASGQGFYRVNIYITVTQAATTSSTMPSTTITYTDGNAGTNAHSTTTTATSTGNSVTTTFAQTTYVLYAKASTNIQYATASYATSGATGMQYALRIRVEAL